MDTDVLSSRSISRKGWDGTSPSLIEVAFPAQKISAEAQKERKAGGGQTLTALGSYWKGRKPLFLVHACVLASLLPATGDTEGDLATFEALLGIDDASIPVRMRRTLTLREVLDLGRPEEIDALIEWGEGSAGERIPHWRKMIRDERLAVMAQLIARLPYQDRFAYCLRPEEIDEHRLIGRRWDVINRHLGTSADAVSDLVKELGLVRFGHRPRIADPFSGGGSIPFAAARMGCESIASDLNPVACMLTWGALRLADLSESARRAFVAAQKTVFAEVESEVEKLGIERSEAGERAKAYLYCLETKCPHTGWMVPLSGTWVISGSRSICARIVPDAARKRFRIEIVEGASPEEMAVAKKGTVRNKCMVYDLDGQTYEVPIKLLRGDHRTTHGGTSNRLRPWNKRDIEPLPEDVFQERLYCIQWSCERWNDARQKQETWTEFRAPTNEDMRHERIVSDVVSENLVAWQKAGLVPDLAIEPGSKTNEPIRTRGWTHWHHLFPPRHLLVLGLTRAAIDRIESHDIRALCLVAFCRMLNLASKLCLYNPTGGNVGRDPKVDHVFTNQALNVFFNYGIRASSYLFGSSLLDPKGFPAFHTTSSINSASATDAPGWGADIFITDPPYADAINYHEITEYFIAWLAKNPPAPFRDWVWDSKRSLAIKGEGDAFRRDMIRAYTSMVQSMPDNGLQVIMFTHQSGAVWADLAAIMWAAGLRVTAAWYISTETTSELKKGGYVQGTVLLIVRKRLEDARAYEDELAVEIRDETRRQMETLTGLNQRVKARSQRDENLFEDADLQMAGYAAALRVLTGYRWIGGTDMTQEALRPRSKGEVTITDRLIEMAVGIATEYLIPEGLSSGAWGRLGPEERFYLKMLGTEAEGLKKLDNYQNFAKAYRVPDFQELMADMAPNAARLKTATEMRRDLTEGRFGNSMTRALLYAIRDLAADADGRDVLHGLKDAMGDYLARKRDGDLEEVVRYLARQTVRQRPDESRAAGVLAELLYNDHL